MTDLYSYVPQALVLFSPEGDLDRPTATRIMRDQAQTSVYREGLAKELRAMLASDATDWMSVVDNEGYCMGEFIKNANEARTFVVRLLSPFAFGDPGADDPWVGQDPWEEQHKAWQAECEDADK